MALLTKRLGRAGLAGDPISRPKARVLLLADIPGWAYDFTARSLAHHLADRYDIEIRYASLQPRIDPARYDLLYVFYWADPAPARLGFPPEKVIREVASYRWATSDWHGRLSPEEFTRRHLHDCAVVTTPARFLQRHLAPWHTDVFVLPKGYEPGLFRNRDRRSGPLRIGWVGNPDDSSKGLQEILIPATQGRFDFAYSPGTWNRSRGAWSRSRVAAFYNTVDVLAVASRSEGQPLCLIEAMAAGCFPVAVDTGIVPEVVRSGANGLIVERSIPAFREAFAWCSDSLTRVRRAGAFNSSLMRESRPWNVRAERFAAVFDYALARAAGSAATRPEPVERPSPMLQQLHTAAAGVDVVERHLPLAGAMIASSTADAWRWRLSDASVDALVRWHEAPARLAQVARRLLPGPIRRALRGRDRR